MTNLQYSDILYPSLVDRDPWYLTQLKMVEVAPTWDGAGAVITSLVNQDPFLNLQNLYNIQNNNSGIMLPGASNKVDMPSLMNLSHTQRNKVDKNPFGKHKLNILI